MIDPAALTRDLGGKWHRSYGVAPCPVCQVERRKDQNALTINVKGDRLLLHCKKLGCYFRDILVAANIAPGTVEIDSLALEDARRARAEQEAKSKARAQGMRGTTLVNRLAGSQRRTPICWARGITCALPDTLRWLPDAYHGPSGAYSARPWWPTCSPPAAFTGPSSPSRASGCPSRPR